MLSGVVKKNRIASGSALLRIEYLRSSCTNYHTNTPSVMSPIISLLLLMGLSPVYPSVAPKLNIGSRAKPNAAINTHPMKIAFQGEPGAYSEKAARELLGPRIITAPCKSFEDTFKAVANREADYCVVPIENSLGGSIHANFDLLLRYDLHVIAEHEFRVEHSLLALPGVKKEDIKRVMSHPQALAQCDNYLRTWGVGREETYDTAGSAKMIKDNDLKDCAAIASDLAGQTYGLEVLDSNIEDWDNNFTRFLLLSRQPVSSQIPPQMAAKTSIVFVLENTPSALYKALACFSLRDIGNEIKMTSLIPPVFFS
jgi:prephenate dehydratase